jgi:hypothetical protein
MGGDDDLAGGDGNDTLSGGPGQDVFVVDVFETGTDLILDFQKGDALQVNVTRPPNIFLPQAIQEPVLEVTPRTNSPALRSRRLTRSWSGACPLIWWATTSRTISFSAGVWSR